MKTVRYLIIFVLVLSMYSSVQAGKGPGYGGSTSTPVVEASPTATPTTGSLYGDLYVVQRDANGVPTRDANSCVQPLTADGTVLSLVYDPVAGIYCELSAADALLVQTVDFGRLNLGRAPDSVINHAFDEAIKALNAAVNMDIDPAGRLMLLPPDTVLADGTVVPAEWKTIDAPAEALGLYIKMMTEGHWITTDPSPIIRGGQTEVEERPVLDESAIALLSGIGYGRLTVVNTLPADQYLTTNELQLAAALLAAAADKTGSIGLDKMMYINSIYGINQKGSLQNAYLDPATQLEVVETFFAFAPFVYDRGIFGGRSSGGCGAGWVQVLQPYNDGNGTAGLWHTTCMEIGPWIFKGVAASGDNARGFTLASDDALTTIEYIHNYEVPATLP